MNRTVNSTTCPGSKAGSFIDAAVKNRRPEKEQGMKNNLIRQSRKEFEILLENHF